MIAIWERFKTQRRALIALWALLLLCTMGALTPILSNENPLIIFYKGHFYTPITHTYTEKDFGGDSMMTASYHDPLLQEEIQAHGWMVWPLIRYSPHTIDEGLDQPTPSPPSFKHYLGTDDQGRDVCARLLYGLRLSLAFGILLAFLSALFALFIASLQGYYGGLFDMLTQRFIEIWAGLPTLFILMILSTSIQPNFWILLTVMSLFSWTSLVPIIRAEFLRTRSLDYVRAAEALGVPSLKIIFRHILPNATVSLLTYIPFLINTSIATLSMLDFLGVGLPPGSATLGELLLQGKNNIHAPWLGLTSLFATTFLLSLFIFIGEGIRDAADPRQKGLTTWHNSNII